MKALRIFISILLLTCLLAGCGATVAQEPSQAPTTEPATELVTEATEPEPTEPQIMNYKIVREDRSLTASGGGILVSQYYDYVVLQSDSPAAQKVNNALLALIEEEMLPQSDLSSYATLATPGAPFLNTHVSTVDYISHQYLCITVSYEWFMGGVFNNGSSGYMFDLTTGDAVTLRSFAGDDPAAFEKQLKDLVWNQIQPQGPWDNAYETLQAYTLDTFDYSIKGGQIILHFPEYEFFPGAAGPVTVETGIFI